MGEGTSVMANIITAIGQLVSGAIDWTGDYLTMITGNDVLVLFCIALPLVGLGIGIIRRLVRIRA